MMAAKAGHKEKEVVVVKEKIEEEKEDGNSVTSPEKLHRLCNLCL